MSYPPSFDWSDRLKRAKTKNSMDGKTRYLYNIFIERLGRSLIFECVYLHAWETGAQTKAGVGRWITFYNHQRPMPPIAVNRPPWSTLAQPKPISSCRLQLNSARKLSQNRGVAHACAWVHFWKRLKARLGN